MSGGTTKTVSRTAVWSLIAAGATGYTHLFGFSYMKGKMHAAGFTGVELEVAVRIEASGVASLETPFSNRPARSDH